MATKNKASTLVLITEGSKLSALIKSIGNRGKLLDRDIHLAAVSALHQAYTHKSSAAADQLIAAMGKSSRKGGLVQWLMEFGPFVAKETGVLGIDKDKLKSKPDLLAIPTFWDWKKDPKDIVFDSAMQAQAWLKSLQAKLKAGKADAHTDKLVNALTEFVTSAEAVAANA